MGSKSSEQENNHLVLPGERLGVIEEFTADTGTYVKDGIIRSGVTGRALLDLKNKRVSVHPLVHEAKVPKVGSIVLGQVLNIQTQNAVVRIFKIGNEQLSGVFTGILHVSDVQPRYVDSMFDVCRPGDIIRAKVISEKNRAYHLFTKDKDFGAVYALCSNCGYMLESRRQNMYCPRCGQIEKRKVAFDYGKELI